MFLTVEEAKKVWCPQARIVIQDNNGQNHVSYNRVLDKKTDKAKIYISDASLCMANGCACWRWKDDLAEIDLTTGQADKRGYCGLAGRPCS